MAFAKNMKLLIIALCLLSLQGAKAGELVEKLLISSSKKQEITLKDDAGILFGVKLTTDENYREAKPELDETRYLVKKAIFQRNEEGEIVEIKLSKVLEALQKGKKKPQESSVKAFVGIALTRETDEKLLLKILKGCSDNRYIVIIADVR